MLNVVFAGTPEFACPCLQAILESEHKLQAVYTQPDRRAGRGRALTPSPVKQLALQHGIPVFQPETLRDDAERDMLAAMNVDVMVVVAYGLILPQAILDIPRYGCINVHASLLPKWRGAAPIQRAVLAGDRETGITIMQMEAGLDTGPILNTVKCAIKPEDTSLDLNNRLEKLGAEALLMALSEIETGRSKPQKQDHNQATHAAKLTKSEAFVNWEQSAAQIERAIRGFFPWPVATTQLEGLHIRLLASTILDSRTDAAPGTILFTSKDGIDVATGKGVLRLTRLQLSGGKPLAAHELLNSKRDLFRVGAAFETVSTMA